ncbi:NlpC/P60 family protein [Ruegeria sp.]|uniref:C40 family peptidase n=1 Tax=Ruegeria sp. TaxID=1879320 RepID=UPI003B000C48
MTDRRLLPFNGRFAHSSLKGQVEAEVFTDGEPFRIQRFVEDILDEPNGTRQCQMVPGEVFVILDKTDNSLFGYREKDGYVGWIRPGIQKRPIEPTHRVCVPKAVSLEHPDVTKNANERILPFGTLVEYWPRRDPDRENAIRSTGWVCVKEEGYVPTARYIRETQLAELDWVASDPVTVAEQFLATPYLYGGDTGLGIDCSGLVQIAYQSCGMACPRDSDMQSRFFRPISKPGLRRGDLVFWKGHVGMMLDKDTLLHSNAYHMAVAKEPLEEAIARIGQKEFGAVTGYGRHPEL